MMQWVNGLLQQHRRVILRGRGYVVDLAIVHADPTHMQKFFQNLNGTGLKLDRGGEKPAAKVYWSAEKSKHLEIIFETNKVWFEVKTLTEFLLPYSAAFYLNDDRICLSAANALLKYTFFVK